MYASVLCDMYPDKVQQMFAYQTIMVREARDCGGKGWIAYDMMFRQQAAKNPKVDWSVINNSLYSTASLRSLKTQPALIRKHVPLRESTLSARSSYS